MTAPTESSTLSDQTTLELILANNLQRYQLLPIDIGADPQPLVIGVSGGADSVSLLHVLVCYADTKNLELHVAHVDHGLRPESNYEKQFVHELSNKLGCQFHSHTLDPASLVNQSGGIEAAARNARYAFLCQVAMNVTKCDQVPTIATAHHADDQAETLLLHLVRGSGLRGLAGMRWKRTVNSALYSGQTDKRQTNSPQTVMLIRPFLNIRREVLRAYLQRHQLEWVDDTSNIDPTFTRNFLRHEVMSKLHELNPQVVTALCRTAEIAADDIERLDAIDQANLNRLTMKLDNAQDSSADPERVIIDYLAFMAMQRADKRGVLRLAIAALKHQSEESSFDLVERLLDRLSLKPMNSGPHSIAASIAWSVLLNAPDQQPILSLHRSQATPISLTVMPQLDSEWQPASINIENTGKNKQGNRVTTHGWRLDVNEMPISDLPPLWRDASPWEAWLDAEQVGVPLLMRPSFGMRIAPLGMKGRTKSVGDLFTDAKVHPSLRRGWPIIVDQGTNTVLWVCGQRVAHMARITDHTNRVLHLAWARETTS